MTGRDASNRGRSSLATRRLVLYSQERPGCAFLERLLGREFEIHVAGTEAGLSERLRRAHADAAVLCFCSAQETSVDSLLRMVALAGPLPVLACCRIYNPSFVHLAASRGMTNFLLCEMAPHEIRRFVRRAMRVSGLRGFLESQCPGGPGFSPHVAKLVDEIVHVFPHRLSIHDASRRLGITTRRLQAICRAAFGRSFTHLLRLIWVHQALTAMQNTRLDNTEIALWLNYQEESSLARIFRKELGRSPSQARRLLANETPEALLAHGRRNGWGGVPSSLPPTG